MFILSNDDELDDEDTIDEIKSIKNRENSEANSETAEPSPGPSASSETQPSGDADERLEDGDDKLMWPNITDLNTRLRRVITSYQRNCRKEEQKLAAAKVKVIKYFIKKMLVFFVKMLTKKYMCL